jgi:hypothetical protein
VEDSASKSVLIQAVLPQLMLELYMLVRVKITGSVIEENAVEDIYS